MLIITFFKNHAKDQELKFEIRDLDRLALRSEKDGIMVYGKAD